MARSQAIGWTAVLGLGLLAGGIVYQPVQAQSGAAAGGGAGAAGAVRVVNVKKVFEASPRFKAQSEALKGEMAKKEGALQEIQRKLKAEQEMKIKFQKKEEIDAADKAINDLQFEFASKQRKFREELAAAEADLMNAVYSEMSENIKSLCERNNIYMVLRLDEPEESMPKDVKTMTLMSRQVVYFHPQMDITPVLAQMMAPQTATAPGAGAAK